MAGDARFHALLKEIGDLHDKKQKDYGLDTDPFANVRGSVDWGVKPWVGAMIRANDKFKRIQKYARDGQLANETVRDSLMDLAVYSLIGLILHDEEETEQDPGRDFRLMNIRPHAHYTDSQAVPEGSCVYTELNGYRCGDPGPFPAEEYVPAYHPV